MDCDRTGIEFDRLPVAGEVIGPFALNLDGREAWGDLRDGSGKPHQQTPNCLGGWALRTRCDHLAQGVVGIALLSPAHGESI